MRFHDSVIEELLRLYDIYGGHREEVKLREVLEQLDMSTYQQKVPEAELDDWWCPMSLAFDSEWFK